MIDNLNTGTSNIEDQSIRISLKMMWTIVAAMVVGSISLAGIYFDTKSDIRDNKTAQVAVDAVQNLQLENIKLDATKREIDLKELKRQIDAKQDKNK